MEESRPAPRPAPPRGRRLAWALFGIAALLFVYHLFADRITPYSSYGYIRAYLVRIAPEVSGAVTEVGVTDNTRVDEGGLLFRIDPQDYEIAVDAAEAQLAQAGQSIGSSTEEVSAALAGMDCLIVDNPDYASGMAGSLKTGLNALAAETDGMMVLLADMPNVRADDIRSMADQFQAHGGRAIIRASADGQRGNPVILPRSTFEALRQIEGDIGARPVIETAGLPIIDVEIGPGARLDVDTPDAIIAAGGVLRT